MTEFAEGNSFRRSINLGLGEEDGGGWSSESNSWVAQNEFLFSWTGDRDVKQEAAFAVGVFLKPVNV